MKKREKNRSRKSQYWIVMVLYIVIGGICGFCIADYLEHAAAGLSLGERLFCLAVFVVGIYIALLLQTVIHEAGHLVFGLLTGYRFLSFRIAGCMWIREDGKLHFKKLSIAGTGGQCLMAPPEMSDGKLPVVLYNLGGSLLNLAAGILFLGLYFLFYNSMLLSMIMLMLAIIGLGLAIVNGVPLRTGIINNDGYNALALRDNPAALQAFWVQMKIGEMVSCGVRLKDMPEDWFLIPDDEAMKNSMVAVTGVFACNRLMDEHRFEEADRLMEHFLEEDTAIVGLHRSLLLCDRMYCEMLGENSPEKLSSMMTKEQRKFMKAMRDYPSVLRTEYVYALLAERDREKAERIKVQFEKYAVMYPYPGEIQAERELMELAAHR